MCSSRACTRRGDDQSIAQLDKNPTRPQSLRVARRLASAFLFGCFLATLLVAARHDHLRDRTGSCADSACVLCSGAIAAGPGAPVLLEAPLAHREREVVPPAAPAIPYLLKLDHSGGAPPLA